MRKFVALLSLLIVSISVTAVTAQRPIQQRLLGTPVSSGCDYTGAGTLSIWLKDPTTTAYTDAGTTLVSSDGQSVQQWNDSSGNGRNASQSTSGNRPLYKVNIVNGQSVLRFDGSNDYMTGSVSSLAQPNVLFVVIKETTNQSGHFFDGTGSTRNLFGIGTNYQLYAGSAIDIGTRNQGVWHLYEGLFDGASSQAWIDGTSIGTGNVGSQALNTTFHIGAGDGGSPVLAGDMAEVLFYDSISSGNQTTIRNCLKSKYGL